jgi:hypothetical protein
VGSKEKVDWNIFSEDKEGLSDVEAEI